MSACTWTLYIDVSLYLNCLHWCQPTFELFTLMWASTWTLYTDVSQYLTSFWTQSQHLIWCQPIPELFLTTVPTFNLMSAYTWTLSDHSPSITLMSANTWPLSYHSPSTNRRCSRSSARRWRRRHDFSSSPSWARSASPIWRRNCRNSQRLWAIMSDSAFRISRLVTVSRATWDFAHWHLSLGNF